MTFFDFPPSVISAAEIAEKKISPLLGEISERTAINSERVLKAFLDNNVSEMHLKGSTGYGYGDEGRDTADKVFAQAFGAQDALVRYNFVNGTHALCTALFGVLRPNDVMLSVTGTPYDTLNDVICGEKCGSLKEFGVIYRQIELLPSGEPDLKEIYRQCKALKNLKMVYLQRSRGYSLRPPLTLAKIKEIADTVRSAGSEAIIMADNCYGEFAETAEPVSVGADLMAGSLIKNAGGGICSTGGYIAGRKDLTELCSYRLTTPGTGREAGCSPAGARELFMGLFRAPETVENALKAAIFAAAFFEELGYETFPKYNEPRSDIITAIKLGEANKLIAFCKGIQQASPIDSGAVPEPWDMPGYNCKIIMAAGCFTSGSSIELSADAPLREPYAVFLQGGISYHAAKLGIMNAAAAICG